MLIAWLSELRRRHVLRIAGMYLVAAWLVVQVADTLLPVFDAPDWSMRLVVGTLIAGFLPALVVAWMYQWTPAGLVRDASDRRALSADGPRRRRQSDRSATVSLQSIAVLPLKSSSGSEEAMRFADGLHDDLLNRLSRIRALKVISRTSVQEYRNSPKKLREIGSELGVATVLEASVQQVQSRMRLNAQLIDARVDKHLWADSFDCPADAQTLFELQSTIALAIAEALRAQLVPEDADALNRRNTNDALAWRAWREAQQLINRADVGDFDRAAALLDEAETRDPEFAAVHSLRARNAIARYWFSESDEALRQASFVELEKARAMDPDSPELFVAEGYYHYWGFRDYARALRATDAALAKSPNDPDVLRLRAFIQRRRGEWLAATADFERALEFDPRSAFGHAELGLTLLRMRRLADAEHHVEQALQFDRRWGFARMAKAMLLVERDNDLAQALTWLDFDDAGNSQPAYRRWWLHIALGDFEAALAVADFGRYAEDRAYCWPPALMRGLTLHYAGRRDEARLALQQAVLWLNARRARQPDYEPALAALCMAHGALGQREATLAAADALEAAAIKDAMQLDEARYHIACGLALAGEHTRALELLTLQLRQPHYNGLRHIAHEPAFVELRRSAAYRAWWRKHGQRADAVGTPAGVPKALALAAAALLLLAVGAALLWRVWSPVAPAPTMANSTPPAPAGPATDPAPTPTPAPAPRAMVAVLPFVAASADPSTTLFAAGLSDELHHALQRIDGLNLAGRASGAQLAVARDDQAVAATRLGVAHLLQGEVQVSAGRFDISARLLRAADQEVLWSQTWQRPAADVLGVQLEIAERVADSLDVVLQPAQRARMGQLGLSNVEAFIAFQKGRALYAAAHDPARSDNLIATLREANAAFARVIELEPEFAPAYYLGTDLYNHIVMADDSSASERAQAVAQANRDLKLAARFAFDDDDRLLIEVDRQLASDDWRGLGARMREAVARQGFRQSNWLPLSAAFGFAEARMRTTLTGIERDPASGLGYFNAAQAANWAGHPERALALHEDAGERMGGSPNITLQAVRAALRLGQRDRAETLLAGLDPDSANGHIGRLLLAQATGADVGVLAAGLRATRVPGWNPEVWSVVDLLANRLIGDQAANNRLAARADRTAGGALKIASWVFQCQCGAPFDIAATPNFHQRLIEAKLPWPPADVLQPISAASR